jgi:DNA-directed RNA polymerase specialized sigma24 family protein
MADRDPSAREPNPPGQFPPTRWTLVARAGNVDTGASSGALSEIVRLYAPSLRSHLLRLTHNNSHLADDLLQGFLTDKVLEQRLVGFADASRGRFRTFLLTALDRYVVDEFRSAAAQKRKPAGSVVNVDQLADMVASKDVREAFDQSWAGEVIGEVVERMRQQCTQSARPDIWDVFESRYLKPAVDGSEPEPHEAIARRLNLDSADQAANLLVTAKRTFTRLFKSVVARYAIDEEEIRSEVAELWRIYAGSRD